jgi:hypothetical protein
MREEDKVYDVALSFAGRDRRVAEQLAAALSHHRISVFYDKHEQASLWGKDLYDHLHDVYSNRSRFCVMLISRHYAEGVWTNHERKAAQAQALLNDGEYILPIRLDDTELPGLNRTIAYLDIHEDGPRQIALLLAEKLRGEHGIHNRSQPFDLRWVDGLALDASHRTVLRPGELMVDRAGRMRRLPRFFYEVPSWAIALEMGFTPNFGLWEFLNVDVREHHSIRKEWPRYIPCATYDLALNLETLRAEFQAHLHIKANGGYRTPCHSLSVHASVHCWGTAVNIYRIGDDWLDDRKTVERYIGKIRTILPRFHTRSYMEDEDHLHLDLGYSNVIPRDAPGEVEE